ncbi:MAG TPA: S8 family serine peptidase [Candidatus Limnocylindria bacterium]|nr:S8 family serine peptidase [Candidatus Limnocylindria bacterium]
MVRRLLVLVSALTLVLPTLALAKDPSSADRFQSSPSAGQIDPAILPVGLDDSRSVTVMVQMAADPVAVVEAKNPGKLSKAERKALKAQIKAEQDAIKDDIAAKGGQVLGQLQSAYNGMRVKVSRRDAASLASLPGVIGVRSLQVQTINNEVSVPYLGVPAVWESTGFTGQSIKVGIIDTGIDYTHANFGGPGTVAAFNDADANDTGLDDPYDDGLFGEGAVKVKGGWDFVGDDYDASSDDPALNTPEPDPDPLDCNGHGSHVAGTTGGFGVLADGTTYGDEEGETYDSSTHENDFRIGPGVAPQVDLYALRVFGCAGSTDVTVEAIDWAVENDLDVINMSLGSTFGRANDPSAVASTNAAAAGLIVVSSAGNEGPNPYMTGSPATADGAISVAATDSTASFAGVTMALSTGQTITALNANGAALPSGPLPIEVLRNADGSVSLGCDPQEYLDADVTGKIVVTVRGTCARVARAVFGQQAGAAGVVMINTDAGYPPFEGQITGNPDDGEEYLVTIPMLGVRGVLGAAETQDGDLLVAADGGTSTLADTVIDNPGFERFASFSSNGPRNGDSAAKPNVTAPGVSIVSTGVGTGNGAATISGTSMASPHVAGVAALVRESHPDWTVEDINAAIQNYADPAGLKNYRLTRGGTGLVDTAESVAAQVVALGTSGPAEDPDGNPVDFRTPSLSFGFAELGAAFSGSQTLTVRNHGDADVTLTLGSEASPQSRPGTVSFSAGSLTVPAGGSADVEVSLGVAPSALLSTLQLSGQHKFVEVSGNVTLVSGETTLRVPYLLVARPLSQIATELNGPLTTTGKTNKQTATVTNQGGVAFGSADVYAWGLSDADDVDESALGGSGYDIRAVGVQSFAADEALGDKALKGDRLLVFAVNNWSRWSNAATDEWDILIDTNRDGDPDIDVFAFDSGAIRTGEFDGLVEVFFQDLATGDLFASGFLADSPTDSSTLLLPVLAGDIGLSTSNPSFTYTAESFSVESDGMDSIDGQASFNAFAPSITTGQFAVVPPNGSATFAVQIGNGEWKKTPALGLMVVAMDNAAGEAEAQLIEAPTP